MTEKDLGERVLDTNGVRTNEGNYVISPLAAVRLYTHASEIRELITDAYKRLLDIYKDKKLLANMTGTSRGTLYRYLSNLGLNGYLVGRCINKNLALNQTA